ncbi:peptidoglycan D,D-transpeptidase FtsI family protein [Zhaonella formicivorans]|uniref:peptidoglycan D,D-transpeptidase FtsI family protein n=1 Tax=Zhaonella formicivorans TaxID=2528593 RepID=UPI001D129602|nr:penicillin-binding protein 2 [Zhaonella formicivorans]
MRQQIRKVAMFFLLSFVLLMVYLTYIVQVQGEMLATHSKNRRVWKVEEQTVRGGIFARNGETLAKTAADIPGNRSYPLKDAASHLVGYSSPRYGKAGLEDRYDNYLLGITGFQKYVNFYRRLAGKPAAGYDIYLTIETGLQKEAFRLLRGRRGAVVALEPQTGAVLALASSPGFDPNRLNELWPGLTQDENSPLLNRAVQGRYPPGSAIKIAVAAGALARDAGYWDKIFENPGYIEVNGRRIRDSIATNPQVSLLEGLALSSNVVFARLALELGAKDLYRIFQDFYFNRDIPFDLAVQKGKVANPEELTPNALAEIGIGQGKILVTPLQMAMITAAIANQGTMMAPYLLERVTTSAGTVVKRSKPEVLAKPIGPQEAKLVAEGMVAVVDWGTGTKATIPGIKVAGKTGSAQNPQGISHAWFVGFAPADNPKIAVAIILENEGAGGDQAAPIARNLFELALGIKR